ncbi:MAG: ATP-binding protein [Phycisphaerales bacterium]|nr:ATP-binding protein [Phycisphaerales bacterium]
MRFKPAALPNEIAIPSDLHAARRIEETIVRLADKMGYSKECSFAIRLALEEAMVNAHKHGNRGNPDKKIIISYDVTPQRIVVRIRDEGPGFDPRRIPDPTQPERIPLPNGRGIMLMRAYLDEVTYNEQGNEIQMVKEKC